jgi:hypothetical protein
MSKRVQFCGVIQGSVTLRAGETEAQAIERAEGDLLTLLGSRAKRLSDDGTGPNIALEINDNVSDSPPIKYHYVLAKAGVP